MSWFRFQFLHRQGRCKGWTICASAQGPYSEEAQIFFCNRTDRPGGSPRREEKNRARQSSIDHVFTTQTVKRNSATSKSVHRPTKLRPCSSMFVTGSLPRLVILIQSTHPQSIEAAEHSEIVESLSEIAIEDHNRESLSGNCLIELIHHSSVHISFQFFSRYLLPLAYCFIRNRHWPIASSLMSCFDTKPQYSLVNSLFETRFRTHAPHKSTAYVEIPDNK